MKSVRDVLTPVCPEVETQLKPHLSGLFAGIVRGYLPQAWNFTTERGNATLLVDMDGNAEVVDGAPGTIDVSIRWGQPQLEWAIIGRGSGPRPPGPDPTIKVHTSKGKTAFGFLRSRFNL